MLRDVVREVNESWRDEKVIWSDASERVGKEHLVDHVHLNEEGYRLWDEVLYPQVLQLCSSAP